MIMFRRRVHPLLVLFILFLLCAVAWAVSELSGQANKSAADAGMASADMEMASLETISKPAQTPPNVNWKEEARLRKELERQDNDYKSIATKAQRQASLPDGVDNATAGALRASAGKFKDTSEKYAVVWEKGNCITRAKLARETGLSRVASADLIIAGADSDKIDALNERQDKLNEARQAYIKEAKENNEISDADKAAIKANLMPKAKKLVSDTGDLVTQVASLLDKIQSQASPAGLVGGLGGCATSAASGSAASPTDSVMELLSPVTSLLSLTKGLAGNASSLLSDITSLTD
jgi:hypothetical protein